MNPPSAALQGRGLTIIRMMKTRTILLSGTLLLSALLVSLTLNVSQWSQAEHQLIEVEQQRYQAHLVAEELRHTSDDLTRFSRSFVITGDERYAAAFMRVRAVRAGLHNRPTNYNLAYWDLVLAGFAAPSDDGKAEPLLTLLKDTGVQGTELQLLKDAEAASDSLAEIESNALKASKGNKTEREQAIQQLYSPQYDLAKGQIMKNYNSFISALDKRNQSELDAAQRHLQAAGGLIWINLGLLLGCLLGFWLLLNCSLKKANL